MIGNPPYIRRTSINDVDKKQYEKTFVSATKQYDMYLLFIEKGVQMLTHNGYLCYINPIRFFNSDYGYGCRQYLVEDHKIKSILDISQLSVFQNAMTYPCVILVQNDKSDNENNIISYRRLTELEDLQNVEHIKPVLTSQKEIMYDSEKRLIVYVSPSMRQVIKKVDSISTTVFSQFNIARGLANNKVNFGGIKYKAHKSVNVKRYYIAGESRTIDTEYADIFHDEMIIMPRTVAFLQSMLKERDIICLDRIYYLSPKQKVNLKYVLGVLNSRITNAWFEYYYLTTKVSGNYFDLNGNQIGSIPIPTANPNQQQPVIDLVNLILSAKKANPDADTSEWERQIDALVYDLYGLNEDEIRIIEG